ncbi:MAG TPA: DUF4410 domain-containing protein [Candidatus Angelobacter sp.]|nr:DUF4410 domain-containing protein [Candidatus Angelobacter sp.]
MRLIRMAIVAAVLAAALPGFAKDKEVQFKTVEAKHFTKAEGVELSPEFTDYLYAELRAELTKAKLFGQVIGEGEVVDAADAPSSIIIEGNITEYKKGNVAKDVIIGFTAGWRSMKLDTTVKRRDNQSVVVSPQIHVRASPRWKDKVLAKEAAHQIVNELKKALKEKGDTK